ncbi:MAG: grasp-with-spasm system SPASM domain peptide maturase [Bacteroidia bacterium]
MQFKSGLYLKLFANCKLVNGAKKSIICDLILNRYYNVYEFEKAILFASNKCDLHDISIKFNDSELVKLKSFIEFLVSDNWAFLTDEPNSFPEISMQFEFPLTFSNAIIDYCGDSDYNLEVAINKIDEAGCRALQLRFFDNVSISFLLTLFRRINEIGIFYVELLLNVFPKAKNESLVELFKSNGRLRNVFVFNQQFNSSKEISSENITYGVLHLRKNKMQDESFCGQVSKERFVSNIPFYTESQNFNSCLNRKISIDKFGAVKNCPSMKFGYGKIENVDIEKLVQKKGFKKYWNINKDKVSICKDCEFRYICMDCRAYTVDENDLYSKPKKCNYDPYKGLWV